MLADLPFASIEKAHLEQLVANGVREGKRLDFKQQLSLVTRDEKAEFLRDVVALANSDGGIIVCGIREGEGDDEGVAAALDGIAGNLDELSNKIDSLLRECIDERLRVDQRPVPIGDGKAAYLIRVPASPLAPHMIANFQTASARFFSRANTSNEPMTARQIKDAALRHGAAVERAADRIEERVAVLRERASRRGHDSDQAPLPQDQSILHVVPLFPAEGGWNYSENSVSSRLLQVPTFGNWGEHFTELRFTQYGAFKEYDQRSHIGFLRDGTLEGQEYQILIPQAVGVTARVCLGSDIVRSVDEALVSASMLSRDSLLPTPVLIQLHLLGVYGSRLQATMQRRSTIGTVLDEAEVATDALVLTEWSEKNRILRLLLDHVWQAWGVATCDLFEPDGTRMQFTREGYRVRPTEAE